MIIVIGEILLDCFADYERVGGAPFNFAYHLKKMGWPVRFISRIGDDADGQKIGRFLEKKGFADNAIQIDPRHPTGRVEVSLDARGIPQFTILENAAYDFIALQSENHLWTSTVDLVYFGSLAQRTARGHDQIRGFLERAEKATTIRFCDINLRPPHINAAAIAASLKHTDILKLNTDELAQVSALCNGPKGLDDAIEWLVTDFAISTVALTRGDRGSSLYTADRVIDSAPVRVPQIVDTVGAGDAYAAVLAAGRLNQLADPLTLEMATGFAAAICGLAGATPENDRLYQNLNRQMERMPHE